MIKYSNAYEFISTTKNVGKALLFPFAIFVLYIHTPNFRSDWLDERALKERFAVQSAEEVRCQIAVNHAEYVVNRQKYVNHKDFLALNRRGIDEKSLDATLQIDGGSIRWPNCERSNIRDYCKIVAQQSCARKK